MKRKLCVLLAVLLATGSVTSFSACELGEIDFLNSLIESASEELDIDSSNSSDEQSSPDDEEKDEEQKPPVSPDSSTEKEEEKEEEEQKPSVINGVDFTLPAVNTQYGYIMLGREQNGTKMQSLYQQIYAICADFAKSDTNVVAKEGKYQLDTVAMLHLGLSTSEAVATWATVRNDYPQFWWLKNIISYSTASMFMEIEAEYALASTRKQYDQKLQALALDCAKYISAQDSEVERALTIYEYLSANFSYAYDAYGRPSTDAWAHNLLGGALYKQGVCETYAKTYDWFCQLFGLECTVVDGLGVTSSGSENHAWNAVRVDGAWYGVDATWSNVTDQNDNEYISRQYFGVGKTEFEKSHIASYTQNYGVNYQVQAPTLSGNYLCPVYYGKKGQRKTLANSIDHALVQMTDESAHYEVELYPETDIIRSSARKLYPAGATFISLTLPKVAQIDFIGRHVFVNATQYWESILTLPKTLTLQCNLTVKDLKVENEQNIIKNGYQYMKKFTK